MQKVVLGQDSSTMDRVELTSVGEAQEALKESTAAYPELSVVTQKVLVGHETALMVRVESTLEADDQVVPVKVS
jgi:hypothetical protein